MSSATMPQPAAGEWRDSKRYLWLFSIAVMGLPLLGYGLYQQTGWSIFWWYGPIFVYGVIPIFDWLVGTDTNNPPESEVQALVADRYYRWAVYLAVPLQFFTFVWGSWMAVNGGLLWHQWLGLMISVGGVSGVSINTAHELGHKTDKFERWLARIALAPVAYGHFYVEHNRGHHVRVATPADPASARFGESFYRFLPRTVFGSVKSAWEIEKQRLARSGAGPWTWQNDNLQAWAMTVVLFAGMIYWLGWLALPFMIGQAIYGFSLLEAVNYLEHYGLCRQQGLDGRYERCQPHHSWNSNNTVTNIFLYHLQRHSDHHANPTRSYQALRHFKDCPQLPSGYAGMILLAYIPPLWFRVMDPKVVSHHGGDMRRANIRPDLRDEVIAKYAAAA